MSFWSSIKNIKRNHLRALLLLSIKHPVFSLATFWATFLTFKICENRFPKYHGGHGKPNAFRHCLWNILIAKNCAKFSISLENVINWTKEITDLHEELNPNDLLPKIMDLKNNEVGRKWFLSLKNKSNKEIELFLLSKLDEAVRINENTALDKIDSLVFLRE